MDNKSFNKNDLQDTRQKVLYKTMMKIIQEMKFSPQTPYIVLQQSILSTLKEYDANHVMGALKQFIEKGQTTGFTRNEQARTNIENYKSFFTPEAVNNFLKHVENLAIQRINTKTQEHTKYSRKKEFNHNGLYIVSDFHGENKALEKVKEKINIGNKVIILGDATDRGENGLEILEDIMNIQKGLDERRIEYIPGNHDEFLYEALYNGMREFESTRDIKTLQRDGIKECESFLQNSTAIKNGLTSTYKKLKQMLATEPQKVYELGKWLEEQPLLRIEYDNGKRYALGHAAFDMDVFLKQYTLKNYYESRTKDAELYEKMRLCLWYRDKNNEDILSAHNVLQLPNESDATDIIVGHTPFAGEVRLYGKNGTRKALCVDGAKHSDINQDYMTRFSSRQDDKPKSTKFYYKGDDLEKKKENTDEER